MNRLITLNSVVWIDEMYYLFASIGLRRASGIQVKKPPMPATIARQGS